MALPRLSPPTYRRIALSAVVLLCVITLTGAAVRLTGSGLGCSDWPNCEESELVAASNANQAIEQVNRLFTGVVAVSIVLAVLGSLVRVPRRRDLTWLSLGLVAGIVGQVVVGGIVVLTHVHPAAVQLHFVLSMVMIWNALLLHRRAGDPDGQPRRPVVPLALRRWVWSLVAMAGAAIATGTVVTGTGPHGGDEEARRFGFAITTVARVHSVTVLGTLGLTLWVAHLAKRDADAWKRLDDPLSLFLYALVLQGAIGYFQYFAGVPVMLVALHIVGAMAVWITALALAFSCRSAQPAEACAPSEPSRIAVS
jgi:cytochrome c oxidase assembly protein subunit 15